MTIVRGWHFRVVTFFNGVIFKIVTFLLWWHFRAVTFFYGDNLQVNRDESLDEDAKLGRVSKEELELDRDVLEMEQIHLTN